MKYSLGKWSWWQSPPRPSPKHHLELRPSPTPGRCYCLPPAQSDRRTSAQTGECTSPSTEARYRKCLEIFSLSVSFKHHESLKKKGKVQFIFWSNFLHCCFLFSFFYLRLSLPESELLCNKKVWDSPCKDVNYWWVPMGDFGKRPSHLRDHHQGQWHIGSDLQ